MTSKSGDSTKVRSEGEVIPRNLTDEEEGMTGPL